jgi:hypothetical protein
MESGMMVKNLFKMKSSAVIIALLLCNSFLISPIINTSKVKAQDEYPYKYYGYIPAKIFQYNLTNGNNPNSAYRFYPSSLRKAGLIAIVGMKDNTRVKVTDQNNDTVVSNTMINSMQKLFIVLPNATFFKVETSELACVMLINYGWDTRYNKMSIVNIEYHNESTSPAPTTFYMSTNGAYVGKEFYLIASQTHGNVQASIQYAVFALEKSTITVTREDGDVKQYTIDVNAWKELMFDCFTAYKIESTGNVMVQSGRPPDIWGDAHTFYVPSAVGGGFVGKTFYCWSSYQGSWDFTESYGFRVSATQNSKITVYNLETKAQILTANVPANGGCGFKPQAPAIVVQSDKPVLLEYIHNGSLANANGHNGTYDAYGSGVGYFGVKPNEDTPFFLSVDSFVQAYIFASEVTQVEVDGMTRTISADSYYLITDPGTHIINSNKKVVVETLNWPNVPDFQGLAYDGVQIPCVQTVDAVTDVTLTPLEGFPLMYIIIGAAAAAIGVVVVFLFMRSRGRK